ncbi:MAG: DUF6515 family protein [Steroidobacteraceae bacterium]
MSTRAWKVAKLFGIVAAAGLGAASVAQAQGQRDRVVEREAQKQQQQQQQQQQEQQQQSQPAPQQQQRSAPVAQQQHSPGQRGRVVERERQRSEQRNDNRYGQPSSGRYYSRPPVAGSPGYRYDGQRFRNPNYGRVVTVLPSGHRSYNWRGRPYYYYGGSWYGRRGASYVVVGAPFGMYVDYLPSYYSTVWVGGTRYYYADDTYYSYDTSRRGYVVTRSPYNDPYNDDDYGDDDSWGGDADGDALQELYVYPTKGQSEKQQADDKYECHRWSFDQTGYDPTQMSHDASQREQYDRALSACLTARGYSVK